MNKSEQIIRTKLRLPFMRPGLVSRPHLQQRILEGLQGPLTLVIAPAGFGKTTLVTSSINQHKTPVAWLSLDKDDNLAGRFLLYLIESLNGIGQEAGRLLAQQAQPEAVLTSLINDLDESNRETVLVLDDYHFISSQEVHAAVTFLLEHCPNTFHLIIATRSDPPLPLARLRARGQIVELRAADLCFNETEAALFLNQVMGLNLESAAIAALEQRTEGWIAGLQMAALSMRDRKDVFNFIEGFSGTHRYILDYLLEEVLAGQPAEIQTFLLCTSILERLSAPLCETLLAETGLPVQKPAADILEYLERQNIFLVTLDDERTWFRYHHLFADLLKAQLQHKHPSLLQTLHQRAALWLEQEGQITASIRHYLTIHENERAADQIELYAPALWAEGDLAVMQMAEDLPYELLLTRPRIGLHRAWLLINQGQIEKTLPLLNDLAQPSLYRDPSCSSRWMQNFAELALAFLSPPDLKSLPGEEILDEIPDTEVILRDAADILYGMALGRRNKLDQAVEFSLKCIRKRNEMSGLPSYQSAAVLYLVPFLATVYWFQGRLSAAAALCHEYLEPIQVGELQTPITGNLEVVLGEIFYDCNRLDEAEKYIHDGLRANEPWGNIMTDAFGMLSLTRLLIANEDYARAMQVVDKFESRLQGLSRPVEFSEDYRTLRVRVQLAAGEFQSASDWAGQVVCTEDYLRYPQFYRVSLARIRLMQGQYAAVQELLAGKPTLDLEGNQIIRHIESDLLLAAAFAGQQQFTPAFNLLEDCLRRAEAEGYVRVFIDEGEIVRELLCAYLRSPEPACKTYAQQLLAAFPVSGTAASAALQQAGLVEPLSSRELEVLQLMALGQTNLEIARHLIVAPGTIKAHAANIYRKLDAANRTEAVSRARSLGLLS